MLTHIAYNVHMMITILLSQLFGTVLLVKGLFILLHPKEVQKMVDEFGDNRLFTYTLGMLGIVLGLMLVMLHNVWSTPAEFVVSALAWLVLLKSVFSVFAPRAFIEFWNPFLRGEANVRGIAFVVLILGVYLLFVGFGL